MVSWSNLDKLCSCSRTWMVSALACGNKWIQVGTCTYSLTAVTAPLNTTYNGDDKMLPGRVFHQATVRGKYRSSICRAEYELVWDAISRGCSHILHYDRSHNLRYERRPRFHVFT